MLGSAKLLFVNKSGSALGAFCLPSLLHPLSKAKQCRHYCTPSLQLPNAVPDWRHHGMAYHLSAFGSWNHYVTATSAMLLQHQHPQPLHLNSSTTPAHPDMTRPPTAMPVTSSVTGRTFQLAAIDYRSLAHNPSNPHHAESMLSIQARKKTGRLVMLRPRHFHTTVSTNN